MKEQQYSKKASISQKRRQDSTTSVQPLKRRKIAFSSNKNNESSSLKRKVTQKAEYKASKFSEYLAKAPETSVCGKSKEQLLREAEEDERDLKRLEKLLKLDKKKNKKIGDGLDFLFEGITAADEALKRSDDSENKKKAKVKRCELVPVNGGHNEDDQISKQQQEKAYKNWTKKDDLNLKEDKYTLEDREDTQEQDSDVLQSGRESKQYADDKDAAIYRPPHLRRDMTATSITGQSHLKREIRGLLNRISEGNLLRISELLQQLYEKNTRHEMNELLSDSILEDCSDERLLQVRGLIISYAALIALLHSLIGVEVGGYFLDRLAKHFHKQYQDNAPSTQICRNLLLLLIYLYNFDVIQNGLLFDLLNLMANNFRDVDIELALVILQNVGARLRSEDPSGLKEALGKLREKATLAMQNKSLQSVHTSQMSNSKNVPDSVEEFDPSGDQKKRIEFMIETILDLKNNKMKLVMDKDANQNVTRVKKLIINHLKEKGKFADNHLTITWTDLISAENKGKWWMVGSVWTPTSADLKSKTDSQSINLSNFDAQLLELARKHRMNTDVRRAIFCIIVGSEDFLDAFEKLIKLELKSKQDRDIVTVLLHCCMQEKRFNPYYAHLAMKLCSYNRNFQSTFKFAYWDRFKELETMQNIRALSNLASLLAHLFGGGCLSLSMLKVVEFEKLGAKGVVFFRLMFITLFTEYDPETVVAVFARISGLNKVDKLRDGINIFFTEALSTYHLLGSDSSSKQRWKQVKEMMKLAKNAMKPKELQMF